MFWPSNAPITREIHLCLTSQFAPLTPNSPSSETSQSITISHKSALLHPIPLKSCLPHPLLCQRQALIWAELVLDECVCGQWAFHYCTDLSGRLDHDNEALQWLDWEMQLLFRCRGRAAVINEEEGDEEPMKEQGSDRKEKRWWQ